MSSAILINNLFDLKGAIIGFSTAIGPVCEAEEIKLALFENLIKELLDRGMRFIYTFNLDRKAASFNAEKMIGLPRVTIYYEAGLMLRCLWPVDGKIATYHFDLSEFNNVNSSLSETIFLEWSTIFDKKAV